MKKLDLGLIEDKVIREYLREIEDEFNRQSILKGKWIFSELNITQAETNKKIPHNLGFQPKDIIQLSAIGSGSITWNYSLFDKTNINISTSGPVIIRAFIGTYKNNNN